jgi:hypothetical protein
MADLPLVRVVLPSRPHQAPSSRHPTAKCRCSGVTRLLAQARVWEREEVSAPNVASKSRSRKPDVIVNYAAVYMQQCRSARRRLVSQTARPPGSPAVASEPGGQTGCAYFVRCLQLFAWLFLIGDIDLNCYCYCHSIQDSTSSRLLPGSSYSCCIYVVRMGAAEVSLHNCEHMPVC